MHPLGNRVVMGEIKVKKEKSFHIGAQIINSIYFYLQKYKHKKMDCSGHSKGFNPKDLFYI